MQRSIAKANKATKVNNDNVFLQANIATELFDNIEIVAENS